ncbi:MAG: YjbQ family protein [Rhizobiales bacterium]|nr:YjbQ family protein [Hyphomicrobiales bacterium]
MSLRQARAALKIDTAGQGFYDITDRVRSFVGEQAIATGLLTVFLHHTSASLMIQENADPTVQEDFLTFFKRLVPEDGRSYRHGYEGPDDMPAHIKTALTTVQLGIPVTAGQPDLGTWQGVFLVEHRYRPHRRHITLHLIGE